MGTRMWEFLLRCKRYVVSRLRYRLVHVVVPALVLSLVVVVAVFATSEERLIHVFPTGTSQTGWMEETHALEQLLSPGAVFEDFTRDNSAFITFSEHGTDVLNGPWGTQDEDNVVGSGDDDTHNQVSLPGTESEHVPGAGEAESVSAPESNQVPTREETVDSPEDTETNSENDTVSPEQGSSSAEGPQALRSLYRYPIVSPLADLTPVEYITDVVRGYTGRLVYAQDAPDELSNDTLPQETSVTDTTEPAIETSEATQNDESTTEESTLPTDDVSSEGSTESSVQDEMSAIEGEDVRVCTVLGIECHTIEFNGFDIGSILEDHQVKEYVLRLSLGARSVGESFTPDKLFVRYFYRGSWHLAGEIAVTGELSNFDNGGHFGFPLPELTSWDALNTFKVELEYVRQDSAQTELYLDSVWVDTTYEVDTADEELPEVRNILPELNVLEDSGRPDLLVADEKRIELTKVEEDTGGDLVLRSDADVYSGLTTARAYFAVTNRGEDERSFRFRTHVGKQAEVVRVLERFENVPEKSVSPSYSEVAYFCDAGWELQTGVLENNDEVREGGDSAVPDELSTDSQPVETSETDTAEPAPPIETSEEPQSEESRTEEGIATPDESVSSNGGSESSVQDGVQGDTESTEEDEVYAPIELSTTYTCKQTGETETCNSFNADHTNCIVGNERIRVDDTTNYTGGWGTVPLVDGTKHTKKRSLLARLFGSEEVVVAPTLEQVREAQSDFSILPRETRYFAVDLSFPVQRAGEFLVELVDDVDGSQSKSSWWRSAFKYRVPLSVVRDTNEEESSEVPTLYALSFDSTNTDVFERALLDGSDVRFYDAGLRKEIPAKEFEYRYVDKRARYALALEDAMDTATSTLYAYFGNEHVFGEDRHPAPRATEEPIEYIGIAKPREGVVVSLTSDRDDVYLTLPGTEESTALRYGHSRDVLIPDTESRIFSNAPFRIALAEAEYRAKIGTLSLAFPSDTHVTETRLPDGRIEYFLERYALRSLSSTVGALEELPLPAVGAFEPIYQNKENRINYLRELRGPRFHQFLESLRDFGLGDRPEFSLQYQAQKGKISRFLRGFFRDQLASVTSVRLMHSGVVVEDARFEVVYGAEGQWTLRMVQVPRTIVPGLYTLELTIDEIGTVYLDSFDFYWGVLAVNTPQSIYTPGDSVAFHMAALDDKGDTICDAELRLTVTDANGNAQEVGVEPQSTCGPNNVTDDPDYLAWYHPTEVGTYTLSLAHVNLDGDIVHQVSDSFEVRESSPFTIRRTGATRIWPKASYVMSLELTAEQDFSGQFVEAIPKNFVLISTGGAETDMWGEAKHLVWEVDLEAGQTQTFTYEYDAPDISPYLYLLGPAEVRAETGMPFRELRQWKLASDAVGSYVDLGQSLTVSNASTWEVKDLSGYGVPANAVVEVAVQSSRTSNGTRIGGARANGSSLSRFFTIPRVSGGGVNEVTLSVQSSATSSIELYGSSITEVTFILLGYWTSGTYVEQMQQIDPGITAATWGHIPLGAYGPTYGSVVEMVVGNWNTGADHSMGIRSASSTVDRRITISRPRTGGVRTATFLATASSTSAGIEGYATVEGNNNVDGDYWLVGYWASTTVPTGLRYVDRLDTVTVPASATTWTDVALDSFGVGNNAVAEMLVANSGTANTLLDLGVRANGSSVSRSFILGQALTAGMNPGRMHTTPDNSGSSTIENYVSATANAGFRLLGYWRPSDYYPEAPTLYNIPFNDEKTGSSTPYFDFSATDPDGSSDLVYEFEYDDDADLDTAPLVTRTSDNETGCSPNCFTDVTNGGDTSPFAEGDRVRFTLQTTLTSGTTYYWRVRAKDTSGSNTYGDWSSVQGFTYVAGTDPKAWYQTEDTQFESGTLSGTETTGSDSVQISATPPVGAMVAYGDGVVQTPRYRIWDGSVWSGEGSAQSVGGTVSWTVLKSAPTRDEYILGVQDLSGDLNIQVYNGTSSTWGNLTELTPSMPSTDRRGFDIAYQSVTGNAVVAYCDGDADPSYATWTGTSWSATSSIDLQFNVNCNWVMLSASPSSDEIVMVAQADSTNTTSDFEAQVYVNGVWGNTYTAGANTGAEEFFQRMAVSYEDSGDEAVVVMGNGGTANFVGATWNSIAQTWTAFTNRTTQDDFEWGELTADDGTDNLGLCYVDEDNQGHIARWDGSANTWDAYDAAGDQVDTATLGNGGTDYHSRGITCKYEVTAGRDGYLMIPYTDATNARYRVWNGTTLPAEASISSIEDSWTVSSARTGVGLILAVFRDNTNARYDFSYWNGSSWSSRETLGSSISDTAEPYADPIAVAGARYQQSAGSVVSPIVDFDLVSGQQMWGEALWTTTEPSGTDVEFQVYYATTTATCNVLVPDGDLPGNSSGYQASASPLNLSSLSTSTYNMLCVKASLTSNTTESSTLDDWTISWERQPYLTGTHYRWYVNTNSATPSDVWPQGTNALLEDEAIPTAYAPNEGEVVRLRLALEDSNVTLSSNSTAFKLQWAEGLTCSASLEWSDVGAIGSAVPWRGYNNTSPTDGTTLPSRVLATTDVSFSYEEENSTATNTSALVSGDEAELDFVLQHNATSSTYYCFRLINTDGTSLNEYDRYPQLVTNAPPSAPTLNTPFTFEALASTTPHFTFVAEDGKGDDIHYEIEVDDDIAFGSPAIDRNSEDYFNEFTNTVTPADKSPFNSGQMVRFIPTTSLSNGTTYWWRVRARDPNGSNDWSNWSTSQSFTVDTAVTISTWYQTTMDQFAENDADLTEATSTNDIVLTPPNTAGTSTSPSINFSWHTTGNAWGALNWTDNEATGDIRYHIEYENAGVWALIPDSALSGNSAGFGTGAPVTLLGLDPTTYSTIRVRANFTYIGGSPRLNNWTISWGLAVSQPTLVTLFDNEKAGTTSPSFTFYSTDPQDNDLEYQFEWSSTPDFTVSTLRTSGSSNGFTNTASSTDLSSFVAGDTIRYTATSGDAFINGSTYWWRVRARDPAPGANTWSVYSPTRSFTIDTSTLVSTWYQTTDDQFETDTLTNLETYGSNQLRITSTIREALVTYAEGVVQTPRYRLWTGTAWGTERSAENIGERIYWLRTEAGTTRNEYVLASGGLSGTVKAQVYNGSSATWGNLTTLAIPSAVNRRGFDVAYETSSGDAMVVACYGTDATYSVWDGSSWTATSTINLGFTQNCEWIELASNPTSEEIIVSARANTTNTPYVFEAQVWDGNGWGDATTQGRMETADAENIGMDIEYEESGGDAIFVVSNGTAANFHYRTWDGATWTASSSVTTADDLEIPKLKRDLGSDDLIMCYVAQNNGLYYVRWTGAGFATPPTVYSVDSNSKDGGHSFDCEYETTAGRDGYIMFPYTDTIDDFYRYYDTAIPQPETALSTIQDSWSVHSVRTGDGNILTAFWDDANTQFDFSFWDGSVWSPQQTLETNVSTIVNPIVPIDITARRYTSFTSGTVVSDPVVFTSGTGPRWGYASSTDTTPGSSYILYQLEYSSDGGDTWALVPDGTLPGNSVGTTSNSIDLSGVSYATYGTLRYVANFVCVSGDCPILHDWTISWSEGITISGTAKAYDESTNVTSGTVAVAVNGVVQSGKVGNISGGSWSIANVTMFPGDIITVFVDGANDANESAMVTHYDGFGNMTGVELFERHLTVGSGDATTTTNAHIALYDYTSSGDEDLFFDVDGGNDLYVCGASSVGCFDAILYIATTSTYRPDSANSGTLYAHNVVMQGTTTADSNTLYVSGSWDVNGTFSSGGSTVVFTATSTNETIDSTGSGTYAFNILTLGQTTGNATWTLASILDVNGALTLSYGSLFASTSGIAVGGDLALASGTSFVKGTGTTTFDGASVAVITDATVSKQDLGKVYVNGSSKTVRLGAPAKITDLTIETSNTFDVSATSHALEIVGNFYNYGSFSPRAGTVSFTATTTGKVIDPGTSSFYNLTTNGVGGNWAFQEPIVTIGNTLTMATGTLTLATGTTTVSGNFANTGGIFIHNNGTLEVTGSGSKIITQNGYALYNLTVNGSGSWSWSDTNATSSGSVRVSNGTLAFPSGTYAIGKSLENTGGTLTANSGTLRFTSAAAENIRTNGSKVQGLTFDGVGGTFTLVDTNLTASGTVRFVNGTTTLSSGTLTLGGSFLATGGTWDSNSGTVLFNSSATGHTISPGADTFNAVTFSNANGGWTVTTSATSTANWTITSASSFVAQSGITLEVGGTFVNSTPSATNWTGSTLYLNSGTSYTVGSKTQSVEVYGTLTVGPNTDIRMWQSSATGYSVDSTGSLVSQDHANVDGELYIYGAYERTSGTDYWSYDTDFDGTGIGGSPRQVDVRFASGASALFTGATLQILGSGSASTTVANQGSGSYVLSLVGSTLNAQHYTMTDMGMDGLALLGSTTIAMLADGAHTLTTNGGSMLTVSSTTIDTNPTLQVPRINFGTSTGVSGYNVTATGTANSYWWFRTHTGNYDGESYDNDPLPGAGSLRWDDSGFTVSVSGTVYVDEESGGAPAVCDSATSVLRLVVDGSTQYNTSCVTGTGTFTFPAVTYTGDVSIIVYINDSVGTYGATISRSPQADITGFNLYQNRVIVRHEGIDAVTIANMTGYDSDQDTDIPFDAETGTLSVTPNTALHVWTGKTFTPGGNVTLTSGGSGTSYDGTLRLAGNSTFTATGGEAYGVGGSFIADSSATFNGANSTVNFTATTSGKIVAPSSSFYNATFSGAGGGWTIASSTTVSNAMSVSNGTVSGTANLTVQNGALSGNGVVTMTGGTVTIQKGGSFGGNSAWTFSNLTLGDGTANITSKSGSGQVTVTGALSVASTHILQAGSVNWTLSGSGSALSVAGTFTAQTSTTTFAGTSAMTVPALTYNNLVLAPSGAGSPTYTLSSGSLVGSTLTVGDGINPVTIDVNTSDPLLTIAGTVRIRSSATYSASSANDIQIGGSYLNQGTFTSNGGGVLFNSTDTGETIDPGASSFHHLAFNNAGGGWTILGSATTTGNCSLTAGTSFTQTSGTTLVVQGVFTNALGGSLTTWSGTTLYLNSGSAYSINTKTAGGDTYDVLRVGANTDIKMWNSSASTHTVDSTGSLYSQDHGTTDGSLYVWGDYVRSSGAEHWSYATDFDGTDISGSPRQANVRLAPNATTTLTGGTWSMTGGASATTTVATQGSGTYALRITAGTFSAQYYRLRDLVQAGLEFSGSPTVSQLSDGDLELGITGGTMMTVPASVITANPVKTWYRIAFATSTGVTSGANVTTTGVTTSSWRFTPTSGNFYGEAHNVDPAGDPGYLIWDDSNAQVTISGNVYTNEGSGVSSVCNGSTQVVRLVVQGGSPQTTSCASGDGAYSISGITFSPGDTLMVYLDGTTPKAANITVDPLTSISDMHLYENRVILRHEDVNAITIDDLAVYDSSDDTDIPFTAVSGAPDTLSLLANHKLLVWTGKTFTPGGNVTLNSGGSGASYDGTLELQASASYVASSVTAESIAIGGSWLTGTGALFTAGTSTVSFTATTSGKVVSPNTSSFNNIIFNGSGGAWTFEDRDATTTNDFTISSGSVTLGTSTLAVGGSLVNSATMSAASTSIRFSSSQAETVTLGGASVGSLTFAGTGAHTISDTNATSTGSVSITGGSVALPSGIFAIAYGFSANGGTFAHAGTVRLYGTLAAQTLRFGTSQLRNLTIAGSGSWVFADTHATTTGTTTISQGGLTAPAGGFGIGGSFINSGTYNSNGGSLNFFASTTGQTINTGGAVLAHVQVNGTGGGWNFATTASSTGSFRLRAGSSFVMSASTTLEVQGTFENLMGGVATDWGNSMLYLNASGTSYTVNTKSAGGDSYAYLTLGPNTDVRMWDSAGSTTTVPSTSSLYSMDHNASTGDLYIWGEYIRSSGADYWSYATDFDGTALGGGSRQVDVRVASSTTLSFTGGTIEIVGTATATTTLAVVGSGAYAFSKTGGTIYAQYYQVRNLDSAGMVLSGALTVTSLSYGDFELAVSGGVLMQVASTTIDQNPSKSIVGMRFGTSTGVTSATNIRRNGTTQNFWDFGTHYGEVDGESYDDDGGDACGALRWDDSTCLEVSQAHFRFREDTGGGGAPDSEWYDADWSKRKRVNVTNPNGSILTDTAVRFDIGYDDDMQTDWEDIRFTDATGTTSLPYFIEAHTTSATATVWVKVPSIPANDSTFVYAYYGNAFATNGESGASTFTFFDDFEDDNISEYSGDTGYFDAVADTGAEGSYILQAAAGYESNQTPDGIYRTGTTFGQGSIVRWMQYVTASQDDEPCTLFGVQTPGSNNQNYGVCFDQYPTDKLIVSKNVSSNDASGTWLASTTVSWASDWYTTEVDWRTDNTIYVSVYDSTGTLFATTSVSDSTHTTGGMGFSFWYQSDAWDFYTVRPYVALEPTTSIGLEQGKSGAGWKAPQDTSITQDQGQTFRARFSIENSGPQITGKQWRLQYADKTGYGTCNAVPSVDFDDVPAQAGCGVSPICMTTTAQYADGDATQELLTPTTFFDFVEGKLLESPSNQTSAMTLEQNTTTEVEYALELTENAISDAYCMRVSDGGLELDSYQTIAEVTANYGPQVSSFTLNGNQPISLIEGQTTTVVATGTVTDLNGFEDLLYATSTLYRSGVGANCGSNLNNCYQLNSLECPLDSCSGTSCEVTCSADLEYFADPTDGGSSYAGEVWEANLYVVDTTYNEASSTSSGVELYTLQAVALTASSLDYGTLGVGQDTASTNATSTVQNTGNSGVDIQVEGTDMTADGSSIPVANQKFATSGFTYAGCVICTALSGSASTLEVDLPKPTSTSTPILDDLYWGVYVPLGVAGTTHEGQTTFYAVSD
jgi:fibronectin-binding autotransporter adhesin